MVTNKKEFMPLYEQAVDLLKQLKNKNDGLNKSIGIDSHSSISLKMKADNPFHNAIIKRLDQILQKLQQSYLDPETARKIGTVKQQYKIQKDRRIHLMNSLGQLEEIKQKALKENSQTENYIKYTLANKRNQSSLKFSKRSTDYQEERSTLHTINRDNQQQVIEYDYEIECKMLKQKNQVLEETQKQLINVYNISRETKQMIDFQGQNIDIISDQIFKTKENTREALKEIKEANELSKKRNKKIWFFSLLLFLALLFTIGAVII